MTETKPKRRWFSFSLRTLFVLVTVIGGGEGWVTYQRNWMRERHEFIDRDDVFIAPPYGDSIKAPWSIRIFGELAVAVVHAPPSQLQTARVLFPEAKVDAVTIRDLPN